MGNVTDQERTGTASDPHGRAALLLVESLIHELIANATLSVDQAIETVDVAAEVRDLVAEDGGEDSDAARASVDLLGTIATSLRQDLAG